MYLIGDIGNTETKIFLFDQNFKIKKKWNLPSIKISKRYLYLNMRFLISKRSKVKKIIFSSVVPKSFFLIKEFLNKEIKKVRVIELKQINLKNLIKLRVNRKQVGSDRLANAIGIMEKNKNYIVIDFGTATTFDVITNNIYLGGIIAPGVNLSLENLINKASLIPRIKLNKTSNIIGKNTSDAVKSGFFWGYSGLIDNIIKLIKKNTQKQFRVILTGGLSHLFKNSLKGKPLIKKDLTINGLKKVILKLKI
ncbi:type III pantothenate kinase [Candidatus Pelagibacter communis]|uniref:type III pantothenate kinase n=1 Tax=Pelagibacter ubique TaxID=198252 RepID=UPI00094D9290|nr:type III pantothenate kinase [Candidatus Pelagibacter ubique]|tara:strand:- start:125 stop:877 length:753 start_codon:yes stop_codon:yes gene_type:complete